MRKLPPIESIDLTAIASGHGIKGLVLIISHHYYLDQPGIERRRIGFTRFQAEGFILRKASRLPTQQLEVEKAINPEVLLAGCREKVKELEVEIENLKEKIDELELDNHDLGIQVDGEPWIGTIERPEMLSKKYREKEDKRKR